MMPTPYPQPGPLHGLDHSGATGPRFLWWGLAAVALAVAFPVRAHEDPKGEVNPVLVESGGELQIYYQMLGDAGYTHHRAEWRRGRIRNREPVSPTAHAAATFPDRRSLTWDGQGWLATVAPELSNLVRIESGATTFIPLDWSGLEREPHPWDSFYRVYVAGDHYVVAGTSNEPATRTDVDGQLATGLPTPRLRISFFLRESGQLVWSVDVGEPVMLMSTQVASPVVMWRGRPTMAMVVLRPGYRYDFRSAEKPGRMDLLRFDVENQRVERAVLVPQVIANTSVRCVVWRGRLVVAYHDFDFRRPWGWNPFPRRSPFPEPTEATIRVLELSRPPRMQAGP